MLFAVIVWAEVHFRSINVYDHQFVVSRITNPHWLTVNLDQITHVTTSKYQLAFVVNTKIYSFILPANSVIELKELISNK
ncbi:hypothetical protein FD17_GL000024 [Lentilactobacillus sunkii DSM 19904]|uniref:Uncharacterized protein n=1 Tax=Lentilactobacillus sunkii DSM 19904 TaxID=1423808 RepID=A0A0R1L1Z8_9LACO|nr:hypothetical protein FD17_GL000024 [Lentilactobacillus sunkii DSM 19904]